MDKITLLWLRNDLRLSDNPALNFAVNNSKKIIIAYILDEKNHRHLGQASKWWLNHSLEKLNLASNCQLNFYQGDSQHILTKIVKDYDVKTIVWNRCYEPTRIAQDSKIKSFFKSQNLEVKSFNGSLLWEPWEILKSDQKPYKVFTHYYRNGCLKKPAPRFPEQKPEKINAIKDNNALSLNDLKLLPKIKWDQIMSQYWQIGEESAQQKLQDFVVNGFQT